jgi:maltose/moltooligosaccharide transporter
MVNDEQKNLGYSVQSALINFGAVFGSLLPYLLTKLNVSNVPLEGQKVADSVIWSFYIGGTILLISVLWTVFKTKEYPPREHALYNDIDLEKEEDKPKLSIWQLIPKAPAVFWQLGLVQFFSWFSLFLMWVYTTRAIANQVWGPDAIDAKSVGFNEAGDWTGVMFAFYSAVAAIFALIIPTLAKKFGRKKVYSFSLLAGGLSLMSIFFIEDKTILLFSMIGVGMAWASILAIPYAMLSSVLPAEKMGVYMGLFNATITLPQIVAGLLGGALIALFDNSPVAIIVIAGVSMVLAAISVFIVKEKKAT